LNPFTVKPSYKTIADGVFNPVHQFTHEQNARVVLAQEVVAVHAPYLSRVHHNAKRPTTAHLDGKEKNLLPKQAHNALSFPAHLLSISHHNWEKANTVIVCAVT